MAGLGKLLLSGQHGAWALGLEGGEEGASHWVWGEQEGQRRPLRA